MNNFQYFRSCLHVLWLKARASRGYRNISLHLILLCFVRFFFSYRQRQKLFLFCSLKNSTSLWKRDPIIFLRFCFARRSPYIQTTRGRSYPEYGWIAKLLYRSVKKMNEKKISILTAMISAFYGIVWEKDTNKISRLSLLNWLRYGSFF